MDKLREKLGNVHEALVQLHKNTEDTSIGIEVTELSLINFSVFFYLARKLETLVKKEAEYGPAPGYTPTVDDVLDYLERVCVFS